MNYTPHILIFMAFAIRDGNATVSWRRMKSDHGGPRVTKAAVSSDNETLYVFGGEWNGNFTSDLYQLDGANATTLKKVKVEGHIPAKRGGATITHVGSSLYVIGGYNEYGVLASIYKFDTLTSQWQAVEISEGFAFASRAGHAVCTNGRNRIYLFGGYADDGVYLNDLYEIDLSTLHNYDEDTASATAEFITLFTAPTATTSQQLQDKYPVPREYASLSIIENRLYLFGGYSYGGTCADGMWVFDLETRKWSNPETNVHPPPAEGRSVVTMGRGILYFGGCDFTYSVRQCYNEAWHYDTVKSVWTLVPAQAPKPTPRAFGLMGVVKGTLVLIGGSKLDVELCTELHHLVDWPQCENPKYLCLGRGTCDGAFCKCSHGFQGHDCAITVSAEANETRKSKRGDYLIYDSPENPPSLFFYCLTVVVFIALIVLLWYSMRKNRKPRRLQD